MSSLLSGVTKSCVGARAQRGRGRGREGVGVGGAGYSFHFMHSRSLEAIDPRIPTLGRAGGRTSLVLALVI